MSWDGIDRRGDKMNEKFDRIVERLIVIEQEIKSHTNRLDEFKADRAVDRKTLEDLKNTNLKTQTIIGAVVFVLTGLWAIISTFKEGILHWLAK